MELRTEKQHRRDNSLVIMMKQNFDAIEKEVKQIKKT